MRVRQGTTPHFSIINSSERNRKHFTQCLNKCNYKVLLHKFGGKVLLRHQHVRRTVSFWNWRQHQNFIGSVASNLPCLKNFDYVSVNSTTKIVVLTPQCFRIRVFSSQKYVSNFNFKSLPSSNMCMEVLL